MDGFRKFLTKTNAIALAIGVIIGGAATALVNSIVENLINPIIGLLLSNIDLKSALQIPLSANNAIKIGAFISSLITFLVIMFVAYQLAKIFARDLLEEGK
jgi:large conductance mechanosensitive channel